MMLLVTLLTVLWYSSDCANINNLPWSYDKVALWADFGTSNTSLLSDYQSQFIATHYNIVSLEKCLADPAQTGIPTEISFYKIASGMRKYASTNELKILFYFALDTCYSTCYNITDSFYANKSMWLKDDDGNYIYQSGNSKYPIYDLTQEYVQDWWVNTTAQVMITAKQQWNITINGLFVDGVNKSFANDNVSATRQKEYAQGINSIFSPFLKSVSVYIFSCIYRCDIHFGQNKSSICCN